MGRPASAFMCSVIYLLFELVSPPLLRSVYNTIASKSPTASKEKRKNYKCAPPRGGRRWEKPPRGWPELFLGEIAKTLMGNVPCLHVQHVRRGVEWISILRHVVQLQERGRVFDAS